MTFMLRYMPRERPTHFVPCLFTLFAVALCADQPPATAYAIVIIACIIGSGIAMACGQEAIQYKFATTASWVTTCVVITYILQQQPKDPKSIPEAAFLLYFGVALGLGVLVYYLIKFANDRMCSSRREEAEILSLSDILSITGGVLAMAPPLVLCQEAAGLANPSLGWPIRTYYLLCSIVGGIGGAIFEDREKMSRLAGAFIGSLGASFALLCLVRFLGRANSENQPTYLMILFVIETIAFVIIGALVYMADKYVLDVLAGRQSYDMEYTHLLGAKQDHQDPADGTETVSSDDSSNISALEVIRL
mmetsp:Transcript_2897/g.4685  ORF Transcript_2897/g.4685 Transcript_2897/m.4685 type:complete len:305 (+) Transcript_2897:291-1205(+)